MFNKPNCHDITLTSLLQLKSIQSRTRSHLIYSVKKKITSLYKLDGSLNYIKEQIRWLLCGDRFTCISHKREVLVDPLWRWTQLVVGHKELINGSNVYIALQRKRLRSLPIMNILRAQKAWETRSMFPHMSKRTICLRDFCCTTTLPAGIRVEGVCHT